MSGYLSNVVQHYLPRIMGYRTQSTIDEQDEILVGHVLQHQVQLGCQATHYSNSHTIRSYFDESSEQNWICSIVMNSLLQINLLRFTCIHTIPVMNNHMLRANQSTSSILFQPTFPSARPLFPPDLRTGHNPKPWFRHYGVPNALSPRAAVRPSTKCMKCIDHHQDSPP